jgi:Bacterial Ig domain
MRSPMGIRVTTVVGALTVLAAIVGVKPPSPAIVPEGAPAGENPEPFSGTAPFSLRTVSPASGSTVGVANGSTVGVAKPIIINFAAPITDRPAAEDARPHRMTVVVRHVPGPESHASRFAGLSAAVCAAFIWPRNRWQPPTGKNAQAERSAHWQCRGPGGHSTF